VVEGKYQGEEESNHVGGKGKEIKMYKNKDIRGANKTGKGAEAKVGR